jgi:hypothetical protein
MNATAPNPKVKKDDYVMPRFPLLTRIAYSRSPGFPEAVPGFIVGVKNKSVNVLLIYENGGFAFRETCFFEGDPRVKERPAEYWDGQNGIFKILTSELDAAAFDIRLKGMEATIAELQKEIAAIKWSNMPRKPGRPPKQPTDDVPEME